MRIFRITIFFLFNLCVIQQGFGQQQLQFSQFFTDYVTDNPAFAGRNYQTDVALLHRQQWVGLNGAPVSTKLNANTKLIPLKLGLGISVLNDAIGNFNQTGVRVSIAGEKRFGLNYLRFGIAPSYYAFNLNNSFSAIDNPDLDPTLQNLNPSSSAFDVNVGFLYQNPKYFIGFSVINLIAPRLNELSTNFSRTFNIVGGYDLDQAWVKNVSFHPTILLKSDLQNLSGLTIDINALALYKKSLFVGLGARIGDAFFPILGYQWFSSIGKFRVGYSYDYTTSSISNVSNGTHEISLNYTHYIDRPNVIDQYRNVRFL